MGREYQFAVGGAVSRVPSSLESRSAPTWDVDRPVTSELLTFALGKDERPVFQAADIESKISTGSNQSDLVIQDRGTLYRVGTTSTLFLTLQ